jgi:DNA polymerase-3 subunit beta
MRFKCSGNVLQKNIGIVEKAISPRSSLPVLENIFLALEDGTLTLRANDLEIGIEQKLALESETDSGSILVKAKTISNIVSKLNGQTIDFEVDDKQKIRIESQSVGFDIHGSSVDDYPMFPQIQEGVRLDIPSEVLRDLIKHTIFAVSSDETKQFLNGILIRNEKDNLFFVATDGYRLALKKQIYDVQDKEFSVIAPFKAINELYKILQSAESGKTIQVTISENQISFKFDDFLLISRVIQGQFPDYKQVLPKESEHIFKVSRKWLMEASDRASIIASESNYVVRLAFEENKMILRANASSFGNFQEDIEITRVKGEGEAKIAFNVRLILDAIKHLDVDDLHMEFNNELSPCVIRPVMDDTYTYILMPIRTSDYQEDA